ncbi:MAG: hypothetical protein OEQ74_02990, partial [Gammaproteobacteria bacterium]|nr:hypothetical protein [Gammaproteobacteria bacterium]
TFTNNLSLELGGIVSSTEKVDDPYDRIEGGNILVDEIDFEDTLGFKAKLTFPFFGNIGWVSADHAGLVADGGNLLQFRGSRLPLTGLGAKREYQAGFLKTFGTAWYVQPSILYREALVDPNPNLESSIVGGVLDPGLSPRNREDDPFAILGNRDTRAAELLITYDPTGATDFYQWDNDLREDARLAFNLGLNYTEYPTATDSHQFFFEPTGANAAFGIGLPPEDTYEAHSKIVWNPSNNAKYILKLNAGFQQSTGNPFDVTSQSELSLGSAPEDPQAGTRRFYTVRGKAVLGKKHIIEGYIKKDGWGPYDFHRQFNITYPEQYKLDYSILLDSKRNEGTSTKIGVKTLYRTFDERSAQGVGEANNGLNDYSFQTVFYYLYNFGGTPPPSPRD